MSSGRISKTEPWVCRLYPESKSRLYVRVQVWPTHKAMLEYLRTSWGGGNNRYGNRVQGQCARYEAYRMYPNRPRRKSPCVAEVNLWRGGLGIGVTTHEFNHALYAWADRVGLDYSPLRGGGVTRTEERLCYAMGHLANQFVSKGMRPGGIYAGADLVKTA